MSDGDDDELQLEPMYKGRTRPLLIGLVVVLAGVAAVLIHGRIQASRHDEAMARAATAWNALSRCLVGDGPPRGERPSQLARRIEIATWEDSRAYDQTPPARRWPYRCAAPASVLTHAMFDADPSDPDGRLFKAVASRAAIALEANELRTGEHDRQSYLDEIFELARRASLPPGVPATGPPPPAPAHPLAPHAMDPMLAGAGESAFIATDPVPGAVLRVLTGHEHPHLCTVREGTQLPLAQAHCVTVSAPIAPDATLTLAGADDDAPAYIELAHAPAVARELFSGETRASYPRLDRVAAAWIASHARVTALRAEAAATPGHGLLGYTSIDRAGGDEAASTLAVAPGLLADLAGEPLLLRDQLLVLETANLGPSPVSHGVATTAPVDAGAVDAGAASRVRIAVTTVGATTLAAPTVLGLVDATSGRTSVSACQTPDALVAAVRGAGDAVALVFRADGRWSAPIATHAAPGATLTCRGREATFTWAETAPHRYIHQTRCTAAGCQSAQGNLPLYDLEPVVTDLDGRVLLVATPGPRVGHGLRIRVAPIAEVDSIDDVVVLDDAEHGGLDVHPIDRVFVRGGVAVILATRAVDPEETYAIRVESSGAFSPVSTR